MTDNKVLNLDMEEDVPKLGFLGFGSAEYVMRFIYSPPDDRPDLLMAEARFPITVDHQYDTGEFVATMKNAGTFNRQSRVVQNAKMEMNALYRIHWSDSGEPLEMGMEKAIDYDSTSAVETGPGKSISMHLGEFIGALLRGFLGVL